MKKPIPSVGLAIGLAGTIASGCALSLFQSDRSLSEHATVTMIDAIKTAEQATPGKTVEVNMGRDDGQLVYKIEIVDRAHTYHVYVNAISGRIHVIK
ncbi:MAG: PepSY domain-containing protein [Nitrospira sp.]|nr:PepSY domain-containing protein [Nitrospira sp.]